MVGTFLATARFQDSRFFQEAIEMALRCILRVIFHLSGFKLEPWPAHVKPKDATSCVCDTSVFQLRRRDMWLSLYYVFLLSFPGTDLQSSSDSLASSVMKRQHKNKLEISSIWHYEFSRSVLCIVLSRGWKPEFNKSKTSNSGLISGFC